MRWHLYGKHGTQMQLGPANGNYSLHQHVEICHQTVNTSNVTYHHANAPVTITADLRKQNSSKKIKNDLLLLNYRMKHSMQWKTKKYSYFDPD